MKNKIAIDNKGDEKNGYSINTDVLMAYAFVW